MKTGVLRVGTPVGSMALNLLVSTRRLGFLKLGTQVLLDEPIEVNKLEMHE